MMKLKCNQSEIHIAELSSFSMLVGISALSEGVAKQSVWASTKECGRGSA